MRCEAKTPQHRSNCLGALRSPNAEGRRPRLLAVEHKATKQPRFFHAQKLEQSAACEKLAGIEWIQANLQTVLRHSLAPLPPPTPYRPRT